MAIALQQNTDPSNDLNNKLVKYQKDQAGSLILSEGIHPVLAKAAAESGGDLNKFRQTVVPLLNSLPPDALSKIESLETRIQAGTFDAPAPSADETTQNEFSNYWDKNMGTYRDKINQLFGGQEQAGVDTLNQVFGDARKKQMAEEASLKRLSSPVSISSLGGVDRNRDTAMANFIASLKGKQADAETNLMNTGMTTSLQDLLSRRGQNKAADQMQFDRETREKNIGLNIADRELGRNQYASEVAQKEPDELDKWMKGFQTAGAGLDVLQKGMDTFSGASTIGKLFGGGNGTKPKVDPADAAKMLIK